MNLSTPSSPAIPHHRTIRDWHPFSGGVSFYSFIFRNTANKRLFWIAIFGSILFWDIFKFLYPFPDFISDSYNYIESAHYHLPVNLWPVGYARFIYFIHRIDTGDWLSLSVQFALLQLSLLYFFFSVKYLYRPSVITSRILFIVLLFNPLSLYLSNCVLSDALFTCITVTWITLMLWQMSLPGRAGLVVQVILMGLAFTLRYTAIYYPIISAVALLLTPMKRIEKLAWAVSPVLLFAPFILFTKAETEKITGTPEFSVFGGWQVANNALYMYQHIQVDPADLPPDTRAFDQVVKAYFKSKPPDYFHLNNFPGTWFIKHQDAPLKEYLRRHYTSDEHDRGLYAWGLVSPIYNKYGSWLISHHPIAFAQYYCWLNVRNYFYPYLEKFGTYNIMETSVWPYAKYWFHYSHSGVWAVSWTFQGKLFFIYPAVFRLLNA